MTPVTTTDGFITLYADEYALIDEEKVVNHWLDHLDDVVGTTCDEGDCPIARLLPKGYTVGHNIYLGNETAAWLPSDWKTFVDIVDKYDNGVPVQGPDVELTEEEVEAFEAEYGEGSMGTDMSTTLYEPSHDPVTGRQALAAYFEAQSEHGHGWDVSIGAATRARVEAAGLMQWMAHLP